MATIGLKYLVYAPLTETDASTPTVSYTGGKILARAIEVGMSINLINVPLFADNREVDRYTGFSNGTITLTGDDISPEDTAVLLGYNLVSNTSSVEIIAKGENEGKYVGLGFFAATRRGGVMKYRAIFLHKVKFSIPNETWKTKGESVEFQTPQLTGTFITDITDVWKEELICNTEIAAMAFLDIKAGITPA